MVVCTAKRSKAIVPVFVLFRAFYVTLYLSRDATFLVFSSLFTKVMAEKANNTAFSVSLCPVRDVIQNLSFNFFDEGVGDLQHFIKHFQQLLHL